MAALSFALVGCAGSGSTGAGSLGTHEPERKSSNDAASPTLAFLDGQPVRLNDLYPAMIEQAGGEALREHMLTHALRARLAQRGFTLDASALAREREALNGALSDDPDEAARLLRELRRRRGLGPTRFDALLWRQAALRTLVGPVEPDGDAVRRAFDIRHGPRHVARLLVTSGLREAQSLRRRALAGEDFAALAQTHSLDVSLRQGGLLSPLSLADPAYPLAVRQALGALEPGAVSTPVAVEQGWAILKLERIEPADGTTFEQAEPALRKTVAFEAQAAKMNELGRAILSRAQVTILDPGLQTSWDRLEPSGR